LIVPGIVAWLWLLLALPICLHENTDPTTSLGHSRARMRALSWPALGASIVCAAPGVLATLLWACSYQAVQPPEVLAAGGSLDHASCIAIPVALIASAFWTPLPLLVAVIYAKRERSPSVF
jgi:hypothetical protein